MRTKLARRCAEAAVRSVLSALGLYARPVFIFSYDPKLVRKFCAAWLDTLAAYQLEFEGDMLQTIFGERCTPPRRVAGRNQYWSQHGLTTACRAQGTSPRSRIDIFKLKLAYSHHKSRAPAAVAHHSLSTPPPDDGTTTHAPRHRAYVTQTTVLLEPRNVSYTIRNLHATASSSCTPYRYTSPCAHQRLLSRETPPEVLPRCASER